MKEREGIITWKHPPQSPDLNPQESVWNVLEQRVQHRKSDWQIEHKQAMPREQFK